MAAAEFRVYNSMTHEKEVFNPREPGKVGMYVCGVTAYDLSHLGHARAAVSFDVLYRLSVQILHFACLLVDPPLTIMRVEENSTFNPQYMEDMCIDRHRSVTDPGRVKIMVMPGFYVNDKVLRYLLHLGYEVTYVRNFTDVDDKIIRRANETGENPMSLSSRYCEEYLIDMGHLQCLTPTHQPRVSEHIDQIKELISKIIDNGCAYTVEGDVYFSVEKFPEYGRLSGRKLEDNRAGERVAVDSRKRHPADFALWKAAKPGEPSWDSPWGPGRPGWHIECSAMSAHYLTYSFDIHGGGIDLIFPHHENELAQSCATCNESKVSYWMHNGHVTINDEKMSKSLGNFFTIREIIERYHPLSLRHFLMSAHYRSQINYSLSQLENASEAVFYIYQTLQDCEDALAPFSEGSLGETKPNSKPPQVTPAAQECIEKLRSEFQNKMSDDMQTPPILTSTILDSLRFINSNLTMLKKKQQKQQQLSMVKSLSELKGEVQKVLDVLGLLPALSYSEVLQQLKEKALKRAEMTEEDISKLIEDRTLARKKKDFDLSDKIRSDLATKGISLMDVGSEMIWRPCVPKIPDSVPS